MPLTGSPPSDVTVPNTAIRTGPSTGAQPPVPATAQATTAQMILQICPGVAITMNLTGMARIRADKYD
jgi:hypothetical protein